MLVAPPVAAQDDGAATRLLGEIARCRATGDPQQRLGCFDRAAAALERAVERKDVRVIDRGDVRKARRSLFGYTLPRVELFGGTRNDAEDADRFTEINTTVAGARAVPGGRVQITLADEGAAVWQTTDPMNFPPRPGAKIRIRQGALGNYFLSVDGRSYRGQRVR